MLITYLELENFKSYRQAQIALRPGTNAIIGANGAGKSTLLEAIGFVLFGHVEEGMNLSSLLSEGAASGRALVRMISSYDEREYEVERCFGKRTTARYRVYDVELGRTLVAEGNADVMTWLRQHLRVDASVALATLFRTTVGVPQGTFTAPFLEAAAARKSIFDPLLQVDDYRKASDNLLPASRQLEKQSGQLREEIARIEGQLAARPSLAAEEAALRRTIATLEQHLGVLQRELDRLLEEINALDRAEACVRDLAARVDRQRAALDAQQRLLQNAARQVEEAEAAQAQVEAAREGHEAYRAAEEQLAALESQRQVRDRLRQARARVETAQATVRARLEQLDAELQEIAEASERMKALAPSVEQQRALEEALHAAEWDVLRLEATQRRERDLARDVQQARAVVERRDIGLQQAQALEQSLLEKRSERDELASVMQESGKRRATALAEVERLRKQSTALREAATARCPVCEAELTPAHRDELLARNEQRIRELSDEARALDDHISEMTRQIQALDKELATGQKRLQSLPSEEDLREAQALLSERERDWENARAEVSALQDAPARAERHRQALQALGDPRLAYQRCADRVQAEPSVARERSEVESRLRDLADEAVRLDAQLADYADLDMALGAAQQLRASHLEAHNLYVANLNTANQLAARRERHARAAHELEELKRNLTELETQHRTASAAYDADHHTRIKQQASAQQQELAATRAQAQEKSARLKTVVQELEHLEALQRELVAKQAALGELQTLHERVEKVRQLLKEAGPYITRQLVRQISWDASALYGDIMNDRASRLQWSEDYELSLDVKGIKRTFRQLSGGEQMGAALALRLALLRRTSAIDVAFFDEPTAHLDPTRRESLAEKIMQVKGFAQLFVISHDDTFERSAQNYIRIVKDEQGSHCEGI